MNRCEESCNRIRRFPYDIRWLLSVPLAAALLVGSAGAAPILGAPRTYQVDGSPVKVVAAHIDAQSNADLVSGNEAGEEGPSLSLLLNRGNGTFFPEVRTNLNASRYTLHSIAAADFNDDGFADIAVATDDLSVFPIRTMVLVYRSDATGHLSGPEQYPLDGLFPQCIEAADVNADGVADIVVCHSVITGSGLVSVLLGQTVEGMPTGTFGAPVDFVVGTFPANIAIADVDGDGHTDLLVGDRGERKVDILYGTGDSQLFAAPLAIGSVTSPTAVVVDHVPGDALPEVVVSDLTMNQLLIFRQTSARTFETPETIAVDQPPGDMQLADFDGDGLADVALLSSTDVSLWIGDTGGNFLFAESVAIESTAGSLVAADLNGDAKPDVAATSLLTDSVTVILNVGSSRVDLQACKLEYSIVSPK